MVGSAGFDQTVSVVLEHFTKEPIRKKVHEIVRRDRVPLKARVVANLIVLILLGLSFSLPASAQPAVYVNSVRYGTIGFYSGVFANVTSYWSSTLDLVTFAVWKNSQGETIAVTTAGLTLPSVANGIAFAPLLNPLAPGNYVAIVFVVTTNNNPVSNLVTIGVNIP
jgi:hypothetical protein